VLALTALSMLTEEPMHACRMQQLIEAEIAHVIAILPALFAIESEYQRRVLQAELDYVRGLIEQLRDGRITWPFVERTIGPNDKSIVHIQDQRRADGARTRTVRIESPVTFRLVHGSSDRVPPSTKRRSGHDRTDTTERIRGESNAHGISPQRFSRPRPAPIGWRIHDCF
jgi:hypothetical protein